jgi:hypothetical protein
MHLAVIAPPQPFNPLHQQQVAFGFVESPKPTTWVPTLPELERYATHEWGHLLCSLPALAKHHPDTQLYVDSTFIGGKQCAGITLSLNSNPTTAAQAKALLLHYAGGMAAEALADNPLATTLTLADKQLTSGQKDCLAMAALAQHGEAQGWFPRHQVSLPLALNDADKATHQELITHCRTITQAPLIQEALATAHKLLQTLTSWQREQLSKALVSQHKLNGDGIAQVLRKTISHEQRQTIIQRINEFTR